MPEDRWTRLPLSWNRTHQTLDPLRLYRDAIYPDSTAPPPSQPVRGPGEKRLQRSTQWLSRGHLSAGGRMCLTFAGPKFLVGAVRALSMGVQIGARGGVTLDSTIQR